MTEPTLLIVSIDTEEDNWRPRRDGVTVENIRELPRLDGLFQRLGVRATYFSTYQVAIHDWAAPILRELHGGGAELGAHLHPWNTPPLDEPFAPRNTMLKNLPAALQLAKLERLTATLREAFGGRPVSFRAGRYGLGPDSVTALIRCGYRVDSSVTPFVSWEEYDDGPTFIGAPLDSYRLAGGADVRIPQPEGPLVELPMSVGYNRPPSGAWARLYRALSTPALRPLHLRGIASRAGIVKRIALSPETDSGADVSLDRDVHRGPRPRDRAALRNGLGGRDPAPDRAVAPLRCRGLPLLAARYAARTTSRRVGSHTGVRSPLMARTEADRAATFPTTR